MQMNEISSLRVRAMTEADLTDTCALKAARIRETFVAFAPPECVEREVASVASREGMAAHLADPDTQMFVAERDSVIVGVAGVRVTGDTAHFFSAYTLPGHGAGAALIDARLAHARCAGAARVTSEVFAGNTLGNTHLARHRFHPTGRTRPGRSIPDALIVEWERPL